MCVRIKRKRKIARNYSILQTLIKLNRTRLRIFDIFILSLEITYNNNLIFCQIFDYFQDVI